jgi:hypothetical protein
MLKQTEYFGETNLKKTILHIVNEQRFYKHYFLRTCVQIMSAHVSGLMS